VLALLALGAGLASGSPEDPAAEADAAAQALERTVERLLADLASDDFAVREKARERLEGLAPSAHAILLRRKDDPDPEVRRTVRGLLESTTAPQAPGPAADLSGVGVVTFAATGTLEEVLAKWESVAGGRLRLPASAAGVRVSVDATRRPYFEALDGLLAQAKVETADGFDDAGSGRAVARGGTSPSPRAYWGAFRLDVDQVHAIRDFKDAGRMKYALALRAMWSPHVEVVHYAQPTVLAAVDAAGKAWRATDPAVAVHHGAAGGRRTWNELRVGLEPPEGPIAKALAEVRVAMRFRVRHARQEIRFEDPAGMALPATRTAPSGGDGPGEVKATLESFGPDPDAHGWSVAGLSVRLPAGVPPERLAVSLDAAGGDPRTMHDRADRVMGSDGVLKLTVRAPGSREEANPRAVRVSWFAREGEATVPFVVKGIALP
jgi:hypothetical protein